MTRMRLRLVASRICQVAFGDLEEIDIEAETLPQAGDANSTRRSS